MIALVGTEFAKALKRGRTAAIAIALVGLPTLIVFAIHARGDARGGDDGEGLFRLARQSGLLVPAAVLQVTSAFLLIVIAGTIVGDAVAGDAASGNLRYLLMRPVRRTRLVIAKAFVAGTLVWACTILVVLAALAGGVLLFGAHPVTVPGFVSGSSLGGFQLSVGMLVTRLGLATAYVAFGYTALVAVGMFFSTVTDTPAGAIGATIGIYVVSEILDSISQLGVLRYGLPTHYLDAWRQMFTANRVPHDMIAGVVVQLVYLVVFGAAAVAWFARKDIRS